MAVDTLFSPQTRPAFEQTRGVQLLHNVVAGSVRSKHLNNTTAPRETGPKVQKSSDISFEARACISSNGRDSHVWAFGVDKALLDRKI